MRHSKSPASKRNPSGAPVPSLCRLQRRGVSRAGLRERAGINRLHPLGSAKRRHARGLVELAANCSERHGLEIHRPEGEGRNALPRAECVRPDAVDGARRLGRRSCDRRERSGVRPCCGGLRHEAGQAGGPPRKAGGQDPRRGQRRRRRRLRPAHPREEQWGQRARRGSRSARARGQGARGRPLGPRRGGGRPTRPEERGRRARGHPDRHALGRWLGTVAAALRRAPRRRRGWRRLH